MKKTLFTFLTTLAFSSLTHGDPDYATLLSFTDSIQERYPDRTFPGLDPENTRIFSFEKIVRALCPEEAEVLLRRAKGEFPKEWEVFCNILVELFFTISPYDYPTLSREELDTIAKQPYITYVKKKFSDAFDLPHYRQLTIVFYCAYRAYRKNHPSDWIYLAPILPQEATAMNYEIQLGYSFRFSILDSLIAKLPRNVALYLGQKFGTKVVTNRLSLAVLEDKKLKFPEDCTAGFYFTLPHQDSAFNYAHLNAVAATQPTSNEAPEDIPNNPQDVPHTASTEIFFHELGHLVAQLLDIGPSQGESTTMAMNKGPSNKPLNSTYLGFEYLLQHPLMKDLFFPGYSRENIENIKENSLPLLEQLLPNSSFYKNFEEIFSGDTPMSKCFLPIYKAAKKASQNNKEGFLRIFMKNVRSSENALSHLPDFLTYVIYYFLPWTSEDEIIQIAGLAYYTTYEKPLLVVNPWCDLTLWLEDEQARNEKNGTSNPYFFRWSHYWIDKIRPLPDFINWCPPAPAIRTLLNLLDVDLNLFPTLPKEHEEEKHEEEEEEEEEEEASHS